MSLKRIFLERLRDKFYDYLRSGPLKSWGFILTLEFAQAVIEENREAIDAFLKEADVTIYNVEDVTSEIILKILVPSVKKSKFK